MTIRPSPHITCMAPWVVTVVTNAVGNGFGRLDSGTLTIAT